MSVKPYGSKANVSDIIRKFNETFFFMRAPSTLALKNDRPFLPHTNTEQLNLHVRFFHHTKLQAFNKVIERFTTTGHRLDNHTSHSLDGN
ncbi:hypothetical protein OH492_01705 [Vibrio chagasii]|nr:hypothetical protein [Vibrio chagasii]